ncbi:IS256 family transposase [Malacoplasma penetrans]|uniref:IS256 family transposase n=1 Tax=Malacoplasma penetrans TaxID=28227 RepID=UPI00227712DC|nr:IS256 family transposase [Malacoplasma penetrans]
MEKSVYIILGVNLEGIKEILGFWIGETESAKQWLSIFNDLKSRGVKKVFISCSDNLTGISDAFKSAFPETYIQKCIVHQVRNSTKFVRYDHLKEFTADMKKIYQAPNFDVSMKALKIFTEKWSSKYGYATKSWNNNIEELTTFFQFPAEIRRLIYTTNLIENVNRNIRKITKAKGGITSVNALSKLIYLRLINISENWKSRVANWGLILQQLKILFENEI